MGEIILPVHKKHIVKFARLETFMTLKSVLDETTRANIA